MPSQFLRRLALFAGALVLIFALALAGVVAVEQRERSALRNDEIAEQVRRFDAVLRLSGVPLDVFTETYSRRVSFTRPRAVLEAASPRGVLKLGARTFGADFAWIVEADDALRLFVARDGTRSHPLPPLPPAATRSGAHHYFYLRDGALHELRVRRLDADRRSPGDAPGWILAARRLDAAALSEPAFPIDGDVTVVPLDAPHALVTGATIAFDRELPGVDGRPVARLRVTQEAHEIASALAGRNARFGIMGIFALLLLVVMGVCLWQWVLRPAGIMHRSLEADDPAPLAPLERAGSDYARLAGHLRNLLESRGALRVALAERAQLDRDLHDGVIQNIYAAGMMLARVRAQLPVDAAAAGRALAEINDSLNGTIRELRGLIEGGAPEAEPRARFGDTVSAIVAQARAQSPALMTEVRVDEGVAARLPIAARAQLLPFVREAVSNAARHSRAAHLALDLHPSPGATVLEIADDGAGFDPERVPAGRGLRNLAQRAEALGAALSIDSAPGRGTRIRLTLPGAGSAG